MRDGLTRHFCFSCFHGFFVFERQLFLVKFFLAANAEHCDEHVGNLFAYERQRPRKDVHKVRQPVRMRAAVELTNVHDVVFVFEDSGLVVVHVEIVGSAKDGHD